MKDNFEKIDLDSQKIENIYNIKNKDEYSYNTIGLSPEIIKEISEKKKEPKWMLDLRLKALEKFNELNNTLDDLLKG